MRLLLPLLKIVRSERGTSTIEYGLILAFIVLLMHVALQALAGQTVSMWTNVASRSSTAIVGNQG
ncbi:MAG TPA: Flp family type IVb pilin [Novosphingobium sp.]|nr:Flp family type IVb pilin [Novosphingobium sp.]